MKKIDTRKIGEILHEELQIKNNYIEEILKKQKTNKNIFGKVAIESKIIDREKILQALSIQYGIKYRPANEIFELLYFENYLDEYLYKEVLEQQNPENFMLNCLTTGYYIIQYNKEKVIVGVSDFENFQTDMIINKLKNNFKEVETIPLSDYFFSKIKKMYESPKIQEMIDYSKEIKEDMGVDYLIKMLLVYAISNNISDLHLEPNYNETYRISGRIDGVRELLFYIPIQLANKIISVIKNMSNMTSDIRKKPQDGQLSGEEHLKEFSLPTIKRGPSQKSPIYNFDDIYFRISTYPNVDNSANPTEILSYESMVIRVLNADETLAILDNLNLSKQTYEEINFAIKKRTGIIIVSGPTGSGKTTTLYALLSKMDFLADKIITFEDPVEIRNMYWTQGERNTNSENQNVNFDFLEAKKSILRQDPDIILMGEIRDEQSAQFALEAANTGHLVLATLHANSSLLVLDRLVELGVSNSKAINSIICSFSQRLVKKICPHCANKISINENSKELELLKKLEIDTENIQLPLEVLEINETGCEYCNHRGFKGRVIIDEVLPINNITKNIIGNNKLTLDQRDKINKAGYYTMIDNAFSKAKEGLIPFSEITKVV